MPLHRDIHWIGRQWAVTGHGMQLIDQKLKGFFDIEASQLWEDALIETMRAKQWLNAADFDKGIEVARKRFPKDGAAPSPPAETIAPAPVLQAAPAIAPMAPPAVVAPPIAPMEPLPQVNKPAEKPAGRMRLRIDPVRLRPATPKSPAPKPPVP